MAEILTEAGLPLHVRLPRDPSSARGVLVAVHGISRNSAEHLAAFAAAMPDDWAVIAPHFDADAYPHYQKLGLGHDAPRADLALDAALDALAGRTGLDTARFHLAGFSGGAQFAHRYALMNPGRVHSLHLGAAGYYSFLNNSPWPRGLGRVSEAARMQANARFFLRLPINVLVGGADTDRDPGLRTGKRIDTQQGCDRVERARTWVDHVAAMQRKAGQPPAMLEIAEGVCHDFGDLCAQGGFARCVASRIASLALAA